MSGWRYTDDTPERDDAADANARAAHSNGGADEHEGERTPARRDVDAVRELGSVVGGRYVLKSHLGRGRYGEIYEAVDRSLSDPQIQQEHCVALHLLHERIAQQTRLLQKLEASYHQPHLWSHPNVVKVRGFGRDAGKFFLVMELLEGVTLRSILDDPSSPEPVSEAEIFAVLRAVGDALKYAHAKGAIHGDIRPEKIFITEGYAVKVLDLLPASAPRTLPFFVEEAASNRPTSPDQRDDVYGLACLAYELFAGRHPYNTNSPLEALNAGLNLAPILRLGPKRWEALARGLALRREHRTASVAAFLTELGITGNEKLRPEGGASASAPASGSAPTSTSAPIPHTRARDDDVPVVGDYSGSWEVRSHPAPPAPPPPQPPRAEFAERAEAWQRYPRDFDLYAELPGRAARRPSRPILWGLALVAGLAVVAAVGVYWNYQPARARSEELLSKGFALAENAFSRGAQVAPGAEQDAAVVTPPIAEISPEPPAEVADSSTSSTRIESPPQPEQSQPVKAAAPAPRPADASQPEVVEFATPVVTISEGQTVATATVRRRGGSLSESSFVWWTSDGSATADDDYANLGARIEKFAAGEETRTIHIPLVSDSKAESRENFYVNLREGEQLGRRLDQAQRIEIVVVDDD
jgi:serine/threonine protein kinase